MPTVRGWGVLFCEGPAARRPVLEPTPTPERPLLTAVRQKQISGGARAPILKGPAYLESSHVNVAGPPSALESRCLSESAGINRRGVGDERAPQ